MLFKTTIGGNCPGGFCDFIKEYSEVLVIILCIDGFIFFITLVPPLFNWETKKPDGRNRILFAILACVSFYFWSAFLALNSIYCFGFLAHDGPCKHVNATSTGDLGSTSGTLSIGNGHQQTNFNVQSSTETSFPSPDSGDEKHTWTLLPTAPPQVPWTPGAEDTSGLLYDDQEEPYYDTDNRTAAEEPRTLQDTTSVQWDSAPQLQALISWTASNSTQSCFRPADELENKLKNVTLVNILIVVILLLILLANTREALNAKAMYHKEMLCKKEEVQRFLSSLVMKPPEVGHLVNCFHLAKTNLDSTKNAATAKVQKNEASRKVITFSAIENFHFHTWRDFSDLRLIDPSPRYPVIEIEIVLNYFPGDHYTADRYKEFVLALTKSHQGKDDRISIDDYFHIEDHRSWTFFMGKKELIEPWWDLYPAKFILSCIFLLGWPFRLSYKGRLGKHTIEIKKAVFLECSSTDEGVSLTNTPGSCDNLDSSQTANKTEDCKFEKKPDTKIVAETGPVDDDDAEEEEDKKADGFQKIERNHSSSKPNEYHVDAEISKLPLSIGSSPSGSSMPPRHPHQLHFQQQMQQHVIDELQQIHSHQAGDVYNSNQRTSFHTTFGIQQPRSLSPPMPPQRSAPMASPRTHLRESTKDIVTAVTHSDINGMSSVNTVTLKDIDIQLTALSGYETYV